MKKKIFTLYDKILKNTRSIVLIVIVLGCNKFIEPETIDFGYQYYPIEIGQYRIYYTQFINYNLNGSIDTINYLTKELVEDTIRYSDGSLKYVLGRYSKELDDVNWHKDSLWAVFTNYTNVVVSEGNADYIKLAFPVEESLEWDGNSLNARDKEIYKLSNLRQPYSYDTLNYENTLTVVQADLLDPAKITDDDYRIEVFASDVGLVYKLKKKIDYCDPEICPEAGIIVTGIIFEQKLIEFGKE